MRTKIEILYRSMMERNKRNLLIGLPITNQIQKKINKKNTAITLLITRQLPRLKVQGSWPERGNEKWEIQNQMACIVLDLAEKWCWYYLYLCTRIKNEDGDLHKMNQKITYSCAKKIHTSIGEWSGEVN